MGTLLIWADLAQSLCSPVSGDGWTLIARICYIVSDEKLDFFEGKDKCIEQDAKLIEPKNLEENENIATLVKQKHGNEARYFIGLRDKQEDSK